MGEQAKNTKERLITTAMDLIWKSSYGHVSVDDICKAAAVNKGSFYHYFPSKIDLAIAAMGEAYAEFKPYLDEVFSQEVLPLKRFENYADMACRLQEEIMEQYGMVCGCPMVSLGTEMAPQDKNIRAKTDEIIAMHKKYYQTALQDMVDHGTLCAKTDILALTDQIYTFVIGQLVMARVQNSLKPMKRDLKNGLLQLLGANQKILKAA